MVTTAISLAVWVPVLFLTKPESDAKLDDFYRRVRPGGPGWRRQRGRTGLAPAQDLGRDLLRVLAAMMLLFGIMFFTGGLLFARWGVVAGTGTAALIGWLWLRALRTPPGSTPAPGGTANAEGLNATT
jgi:hypothetical protein